MLPTFELHKLDDWRKLLNAELDYTKVPAKVIHAAIALDPKLPEPANLNYNEMLYVRVIDAKTGKVVRDNQNNGPNGFEYCAGPICSWVERNIEGFKDGEYNIEYILNDKILTHHFIDTKMVQHLPWKTLEELKEARSWWFDQLPAFGIPVKRVSEDTISFPLQHPLRTRTLALISMADYLQRMPGLLAAYKDLLDRCPGYEPWHLFQVAHMLPWSQGWDNSTNLAAEWYDKLAGYFRPFAHGVDYQLGFSKGTFPLTESFNDAVPCTEGSPSRWDKSLNNNVFAPVNDERIPRYDWNSDQFADFARAYIDEHVGQEALDSKTTAVCG